MKIGFIGMGNMARAILGGILKTGIVDASEVFGSAYTQETCDRMATEYGIKTMVSNAQVARDADVLILAVKPQFLKVVIADIMDAVDENKLIISVAAGKTIKWIMNEFEKPVKVVRVMPNTAALVGEGCAALCRNENVSDADLSFAMELMHSVGSASVVPENLMDVVCGISGVPAYTFMMIEAVADAAVADGMPRGQAYPFAAQTVLGAARMVLETGKHPGELKDMVCSPGGTTIEAVNVLEQDGFRGAVFDAVRASTEKSKQL